MSMAASQPLGSLIRRLRLRAALSQEELAARSGVSARAISDLERGQRAAARFETVRLLADALELSPDDRAVLTQTAQTPLVELTLGQPLSAAHAVHGLPVFHTSFVGRHTDVGMLVGELTSGASRLVTLTGPGGVGKTRLAHAVASRAAAHFADRLGWVDLSPLLESQALTTAICDGVGITETLEQRRFAALCRLFADRPFLLVLDNFEQVVDAAPVVTDLLAAIPSLSVLVTSRAPLRVAAEREVPVVPLALPPSDVGTGDLREIEAVQLFVDRARAADRGFVLTPENGPAVAGICQRLEGLPLAIELAASRVNILPPRQLLERLEHRLPLLTHGPRDAPRRQRTMSEAIAWSYNLLEPDAQTLFRQVSVFVGGFTLDTVEWLLSAHGGRRAAGIDALTRLTDNNLVTHAEDAPDGRRFTMFETIREFGTMQLVARQELREAHDLLAGYCQSLARFGDGVPTCIVPEPWVAMVDRERSNIRAAFHHLTAAKDLASAFAFATAFGHYLYNRGPIDEGWSWFEQSLEAPVSEPTVRLQGLYWASHLSSQLKMADTANRLAREALAIARELGDVEWQAATVHCLAVTQAKCGTAEHAEALFHEELRLWKQAGVPGLSGFAFMSLGVFAFERGEATRAHELADRAEAVLAGMGGVGWIGMTRWHRGQFSLAEGLIAEAAVHFWDSVRLAHEQKTTMIEHMGLVGLAAVAAEIGLHESAGGLIGAAERSLERTGQHPHGAVKDLYDRTTSTSQSVVGVAAFDAARELGDASGFAEWSRTAELIRRAAAERTGVIGVGGRIGGHAPGAMLRPNVAAD